MSRGFGSTFGVGASDSISTQAVLTFSGKQSFSFWAYINGSGGGALGRILSSTAAGIGGITMLIDLVGAGTQFRLSGWFSTTTGDFRIAAPSSGSWHHILMTYDASSSSNVPVMYLDGVSQSITTTTSPVGSANGASSTNGIIGNNGGGVRNWDGMIAHLAAWNIILNQGDATYLAAGNSPYLNHKESLMLYPPLYGNNNPETDLINGTSSSITGTLKGSSDPAIKAIPGPPTQAPIYEESTPMQVMLV